MQGIALRIPGIVFIRCGKTRRHGSDCHKERRALYSQIPRNGVPAVQGRTEAPGLARRHWEQEQCEREPYCGFQSKGCEAG